MSELHVHIYNCRHNVHIAPATLKRRYMNPWKQRQISFMLETR